MQLHDVITLVYQMLPRNHVSSELKINHTSMSNIITTLSWFYRIIHITLETVKLKKTDIIWHWNITSFKSSPRDVLQASILWGNFQWLLPKSPEMCRHFQKYLGYKFTLIALYSENCSRKHDLWHILIERNIIVLGDFNSSTIHIPKSQTFN